MGHQISDTSEEFLAEMRDRIRSLERRLDEEQEARRRADTILAQLSQANEEQALTIRQLAGSATPPQPRAKEARGRTPSLSMWKRVLIGLQDAARDKDAYSRPFVRVVLPTYVVGCLLVWAVVAIWVFASEHPEDPVLSQLLPHVHLFVIWGFGVYAGLRDGERYPFNRFHYAGLVTAIGATLVMAGVSVVDQGRPIEELLRIRNIVVMSNALVMTYALFVFGALLARSLVRRAAELKAEQVEQGSPSGNVPEGGESAASAGTSLSLQAALGLVGTIVTALFSFFGVLVQTFAGVGG